MSERNTQSLTALLSEVEQYRLIVRRRSRTAILLAVAALAVAAVAGLAMQLVLTIVLKITA